MGRIFYLIGKSSSGKDTIYKRLSEREELGLYKLILYTTRPIRIKEKNGVEYFFVTEEVLKKFEKAGKLIEMRAYNTVHGIWKYFTVDDNQVDLEKNDYLVIGTPESLQATRKYFGDDCIVPIFIESDDGDRLQRALNREKKQEHPRYAEMCRRYLADQGDFSEEKLQAAGITKIFYNEDLDQCLEEIISYILLFRN